MSWYDDEWVAIKEVCAQIECEEVFTMPQNPNSNEVATNGNNTHKTLNAWRIHFVVMLNVVHELTNVDNLNLLTIQKSLKNVDGNKFASTRIIKQLVQGV